MAFKRGPQRATSPDGVFDQGWPSDSLQFAFSIFDLQHESCLLILLTILRDIRIFWKFSFFLNTEGKWNFLLSFLACLPFHWFLYLFVRILLCLIFFVIFIFSYRNYCKMLLELQRCKRNQNRCASTKCCNGSWQPISNLYRALHFIYSYSCIPFICSPVICSFWGKLRKAVIRKFSSYMQDFG